jgi:hypothetical protein
MFPKRFQRVRMRRPRRSLSAIVGLLFCGLPAGVLGSVRTIVVDAPESCVRRARSHVFVKSGEGFNPAFADCNSTTTVRRVFRVFVVQAPLFHRGPGLVLVRVAHAMRHMAGIPLFYARDTQRRAAHREARLSGDVSASAIALAEPATVGAVADERYRHKRSKSLSGKVFFRWAHTPSIQPSRPAR